MPETHIRILELAADGLTFAQIGEQLGLTTSVVKSTAIRIERKLGADNITQAVAMALRRKLIE